LPIYVWIIEHPEGIIAVDTGETSRASDRSYFPRWHPYFNNLNEYVKSEEEIGPELQDIGISPNEVRWVIMTHFHTDHAGAEIVVMRKAFQMASGIRGQIRGFLPQHWPAWFTPKLIDLKSQPFGPFPTSLKITKTEDVVIVPTSGHTDAHVSVILIEPDLCYFFAGDASYTQELMLKQKVDGVSPNEQQARLTLHHINQFVREQPTIYLPTHDPLSTKRLSEKDYVHLER
jgi:N-acyl homoserine lactone hydrolase